MMKNNLVAMITWKKITSLRDTMMNSIDYDIRKALSDNYVENFVALNEIGDILDSIIYRFRRLT